jgi:hypothetical protein
VIGSRMEPAAPAHIVYVGGPWDGREEVLELPGGIPTNRGRRRAARLLCPRRASAGWALADDLAGVRDRRGVTPGRPRAARGCPESGDRASRRVSDMARFLRPGVCLTRADCTTATPAPTPRRVSGRAIRRVWASAQRLPLLGERDQDADRGGLGADVPLPRYAVVAARGRDRGQAGPPPDLALPTPPAGSSQASRSGASLCPGGGQNGGQPPNQEAPGGVPEASFVFRRWSGRSDSNARPPEPHSGALPSCATPRRLEQ